MNIIKPHHLHTSPTDNTILSDAIRDIDNHLGAGFAKSHPELIAACLKAGKGNNQELLKRFDDLNEILMKIYRRFDDYADRD